MPRAPVSTRVGRRARRHRRQRGAGSGGSIILGGGSGAASGAGSREAAPTDQAPSMSAPPRREHGRAAVQPRFRHLAQRRSARGPPAAFPAFASVFITASLSVRTQSASLCPSVPHSFTRECLRLPLNVHFDDRLELVRVAVLQQLRHLRRRRIRRPSLAAAQPLQPAQAQQATSSGHSTLRRTR